MPVKKKTKSTKPKTKKPVAKKKAPVLKKVVKAPVKKKTAKVKAPVRKTAPKITPKPTVKATDVKKAPSKAVSRPKVQKADAVNVVHRISAPRSSVSKRLSRSTRTIHQYNYMKAPGVQHDFQVGDKVEVFCDHEKGRERIRGWLVGIVVQVDNKMVAVQFRSNVYLTDGWMVPDRILWYSTTSDQIHAAAGTKKALAAKKLERVIPDY